MVARGTDYDKCISVAARSRGQCTHAASSSAVVLLYVLGVVEEDFVNGVADSTGSEACR